MLLKRVDVVIRQAIRIKNRYFGIITKNKKSDEFLKSVILNHIIIYSNYKLIKKILRQNKKITQKTFRFLNFFEELVLAV